MSAKTASPTASLLRSSRFFSMPRPLPLPSTDLMGHVQSQRTSDSATLPYPIQQVVTTTPSSLVRGDWGLKRPLPLRSTTRSSTPILRINAIDTREHITDFASGSDLSLNLRRIQELNMSVTTKPRKLKKSGMPQRVNVFEPNLDNTARTEDVADQRWKFKGPWVAGMTQGDFDAYVEDELRRRGGAFMKFLRQHATQQVLAAKKSSQRFEGTFGMNAVGADAKRPVMSTKMQVGGPNEHKFAHLQELSPSFAETSAPRVVDEAEATVRHSPGDAGEGVMGADPVELTLDREVDDYIRRLRKDFALGTELELLVEKFLDLPGSGSTGSRVLDYGNSFYESGPPKTHPSAGLSYLRSDAFLDNHPLFGPQREHKPQEARILKSSSGPRTGGTIGVAGLVSHETGGEGRIRSVPNALDDADKVEVMDRKGNSMGLGTPGGNRIWVQPTGLGINSQGRIILETSNSTSTNIGVHTGALAAPTYSQVPKRSPLIKGFDSMPRSDQFASRVSARRRPSAAGGRKDETGNIVADLSSLFDKSDAAKQFARRRGLGRKPS